MYNVLIHYPNLGSPYLLDCRLRLSSLTIFAEETADSIVQVCVLVLEIDIARDVSCKIVGPECAVVAP